MKTRSGYWISGGLIGVAIAGVILWVVLSLSTITDKVDGFTRVAAGDSDTVRLEAHKYVVYYEGDNADEYAPTLEVMITDENEQPLPNEPYISDLTYSFGGHEGSAQATVTPPHAGEYHIDVRGIDLSGNAGVAIGESLSRSLLRAIFGAVLIGALFGLSGIALLATTIVRRHNARKGPGGPPPSYGPPPTPYGGPPAPAYGAPDAPFVPAPSPHAQPPPPPYGQVPAPGPPPEQQEPPPPPSLWGGDSSY